VIKKVIKKEEGKLKVKLLTFLAKKEKKKL